MRECSLQILDALEAGAAETTLRTEERGDEDGRHIRINDQRFTRVGEHVETGDSRGRAYG